MKQEKHALIAEQVETLQTVLDRDIDHLNFTTDVLDQLRSLVIKRDDSGLTALLDEVRTRNNAMRGQDEMREGLRTTLATVVGCSENTPTLSELVRWLPQSFASALQQKRATLQTQVETLQRQWQLTSLLLHDCARINRRLFEAIFKPPATQRRTYGPAGTQTSQAQSNLLNMHY